MRRVRCAALPACMLEPLLKHIGVRPVPRSLHHTCAGGCVYRAKNLRFGRSKRRNNASEAAKRYRTASARSFARAVRRHDVDALIPGPRVFLEACQSRTHAYTNDCATELAVEHINQQAQSDATMARASARARWSCAAREHRRRRDRCCYAVLHNAAPSVDLN